MIHVGLKRQLNGPGWLVAYSLFVCLFLLFSILFLIPYECVYCTCCLGGFVLCALIPFFFITLLSFLDVDARQPHIVGTRYLPNNQYIPLWPGGGKNWFTV